MLIQDFNKSLQQQSCYICTEDSEYSFEYVIQQCLSGYLFLNRFIYSFYNSEYVQHCYPCSVVHFKDLNSSIARRYSEAFDWVIGSWARVMSKHSSLVHVCRMMELTAHRKEFRRKGF